jgi:hypothetical protein
MRFRAMPQSQARNFSGSRKSANGVYAVMKVSGIRSSLWPRLPVVVERD